MSSAREEILTRIRTALSDVPAGESRGSGGPVRAYRRQGDLPPSEVTSLFAERVSDYAAEVRMVEASEVRAAAAEACAGFGLTALAVPSGLPEAWRPDGIELVEDRELPVTELNRIDGALTGCAVAIAETGTVVLDGQRLSGRRVLTLVPDHHICVVRSDQIVQLVPQAMAVLEAPVKLHGVPVTLVSGPSASSDIELSRVEGVHGPRRLLVLVAV